MFSALKNLILILPLIIKSMNKCFDFMIQKNAKRSEREEIINLLLKFTHRLVVIRNVS